MAKSDFSTLKVDYNKSIGGEKIESYQDIKKNSYKPVKKSQTEKVVPISRFQDFYDELLNYRNSKVTGKGSKENILTEDTIYEIYSKMPLDHEELIKIKGVGPIKLEKYGDEIIAIINKYLDLKPVSKPEINRTSDDKESIGNRWTSEEEKQLLEEYSKGMKISEIAKIHSKMIFTFKIYSYLLYCVISLHNKNEKIL